MIPTSTIQNKYEYARLMWNEALTNNIKMSVLELLVRFFHSTSRTFRTIIIETEGIQNAHAPWRLCCCDRTKRLKALQLDQLVYLELRRHHNTNGTIQNAYLSSGLCICDWTKRHKALQFDRLAYLKLRSLELRKKMYELMKHAQNRHRWSGTVNA